MDPIVMSSEEYLDHDDNMDGLCLNCLEWTDGGCEPDARYYECESCGQPKVHGAQEAMMMGMIEISEE